MMVCQDKKSQIAEAGHSRSEKEQVGRAAGTVGFYTLLSRILGLIRDIVVARYFGTGMAADAFFVAFRIPNLLRRLFAEGSLTIAFIPVFTEYLTLRTREDAFRLARVVLTVLSIILALVTLAGVFLSPWIVRIQAFGFGGAGVKYDLTVLLTRITFPYIFCISLVALFMGILNSLRRFAAPAAAPIFLNLGIIATVFWISPRLSQPVIGLAIGVIIGGLLQLGLQVPSLLKEGLPLLPLWVPDHPALRKIGRLMLPAVFGSAIYQLNQFMGTLLASFLAEGSVSWLYYADRLVQFPLGVFAIAISTAALPSLSKQAAEKDLEAFRVTLEYAVRLVLFITIPATVGLIILGRPILELFFERGAFNTLSTVMTNQALFYYAIGLLAFSGVRVMISAFYALQDTKTPVIVAAVAFAANLIFSLYFMGPLRHGGLALALSLASFLQFFLLVALLRRRGDLLELKPIMASAWKCILAAFLMGGGVFWLKRQWGGGFQSPGPAAMAVKLFCLILLGVFIYFMVTWLLGCKEPRSLWRMLKRGSGKRGKGIHGA